MKTFADAKRIIRGVATTGDVDKVSDVVVPAGVKWAAHVPVLYGHDHKKVVGIVRKSKLLADQWHVEVEFPPKGKSASADDAYALAEFGALARFSIGFRPVKGTPNKHGGMTYTESLVQELSLVAVPCNDSAVVTAVSTQGGAVNPGATPRPQKSPASANKPTEAKKYNLLQYL